MPSILLQRITCLGAITVVTACSSSKPTPAPVPDAAARQVVSAGAVTATTSDSTAGVLRGAAPGAPAARRDRSTLTRDEIRSTQFNNMFEVIRALRGNWVRTRTAESFGKSSVVQVYLDMQRLTGGLDELRQLTPVNVDLVRFLDPIQASARFGLDHGAGALMITTAKR
jgi:hypothetical protein